MPDENPPPAGLNPAERAKQKRSVLLACGLLVLVAAALLCLPLNQIPYSIRVFMAAGDIVVAAVLWLVARQKFSE